MEQAAMGVGTRWQAGLLGLAGALLVLVAWVAAPVAGPLLVLAGAAVGWLARRPGAVAPVPVTAPAEPDEAARFAQQLSTLRHDIRGILSPAMLIADRLLAHDDPAVKRAGELVNRTVERAAARLAESKA